MNDICCWYFPLIIVSFSVVVFSQINKNLLSMVNNSKVTDKYMLYQVSYLAERVFSMEEDISPSMEVYT